MDERDPDEMDVLRALAHPVRWGILQRLAAEPGICACDFTEFFDVSQPTISVHLDRKSTRLNSSHLARSRMPSSA